MNHPLRNIKTEAQKILLSRREKDLMLRNIMPPTVSARSARSPYQFHWLSMRVAMPVVLVLIATLGGGTAYAAQNALPGDPLYSIKVSVTEPLEGALAFSNEAKAKFHVSIVDERMQEAETLASQGRLTSSSTESIESDVAVHAAAAAELAQTLKDSNPAAATEVVARVDSSLAAHSAVLSQLADDSNSEVTKENSNALALRVAMRVVTDSGDESRAAAAPVALKAAAPMQVQTLSVSAEPEQSAATTSLTTQFNVSLQKQATKALNSAYSLFGSIQSSLDASTTAQVEARLAALDALVSAGQYKDALGQALELSVYLKAEKKFNHNILESVLKNTDAAQQSRESVYSQSEGNQSSSHKDLEVPEVKMPDIQVHIDD